MAMTLPVPMCAATDLAIGLRTAKPDARWSYAWSHKRKTRAGDDGRIQIGSSKIRLEPLPRTSVVPGLPPDGSQSVLAQMPAPTQMPAVLVTNRSI